ncbi:hypothetical protein [Micromonospora zamorensis]|uniref:hypothetical protein n=1 Tax=Micromonospora zamorensis TaxID=709883 RepID=UPI002E28D5D6|nr:hypothetical protein [Micromonospora zamorensis]
MATEHGFIDLDQRGGGPAGSDESPGERVLSRQRVALYLVATFALGVALGGVGVAKFQERREQQAQSPTVWVDAMAGPTSGGNGRDGNAEVDAQLTVVNAGSIPVMVRFVGAQETGMQVRDTGQSLLLVPGSTGGIGVRLMVDCRMASLNPLPMRFLVQTPDQQTAELTTPVEVGAWHEPVDALCNASPQTSG